MTRLFKNIKIRFTDRQTDDKLLPRHRDRLPQVIGQNRHESMASASADA